MSAINALYISDEKDNLVFDYPISGDVPKFSEVISKVSSLLSKTIKKTLASSLSLYGQKNSLLPVIRVTPKYVAYHYSTKYLTYFVVCEQRQISEPEKESVAEQTVDDEYGQISDEEDEYESEEEDEEEDADDDEVNEDDESSSDNNSFDIPLENTSTYNPLVPLEFLRQLITTMTDYFGDPLVPVKLEANYDTLCLLLSEMIEDNYPFVTDLNQLKDTVQFEGALSRFLSSTTSSKPSSTTVRNMARSGAFSSSSSLSSMAEKPMIPWRKANVKYSNNELFVDFIEHINLVMSPYKGLKDNLNSGIAGSSAFYSASTKYISHSKPVIAKIDGEIHLTSHLSGIPDLQMVLNTNGHDLGVPIFHPCIRIDKWQNSAGLMSFIPPDGKAILAKYEIDLESLRHSNRILQNSGIIQAEFKTELGLSDNEFEITLYISNLKTVKNIEKLKVEINTELHKDNISAIKILRMSNGDFQFNTNGRSEWVFEDHLATGINPVFRGVVVYNDEENDDSEEDDKQVKSVFPNHISLSYSYKGALPSGIKVGSLKVVSAKGMGDNIKPYKGVKYITKTGQFILR